MDTDIADDILTEESGPPAWRLRLCHRERRPDPTREARVLERACLGYQVVEGCITARVYRGRVELECGSVVTRFWIDGMERFYEDTPRVDRPSGWWRD